MNGLAHGMVGRFRWIVFSAVCAGVIAGAAMSVAHHLVIVPLIERAEVYESAAAFVAETKSTAAPAAGTARVGHADTAHNHGPAGSRGPSGAERAILTSLTNLLAGIGFALLLTAGLTLSGGQVSVGAGVAWGIAGFGALSLAPAIGLPPELPGAEAAPLLARQVWWLATAIATATGLALMAFGYRLALAILGLLLIVLPHLWGAPRPPVHVSPVPVELTHMFMVAAMVTNFLFWLLLGLACVYFLRRFTPATTTYP